MEEDKPTSLGQYCEISTCMGVTDCYLTKPFLGKIFWSTIIIIGLAVTAFQTYYTFTDYLNETDFTASISKETEVHGIKFPKITVCNFNRAKQSVINSTNLDPKVLTAVFQLFPTTYDIPLFMLNDTSVFEIYQDALTKYVTDTHDTEIPDFLRKYGHNADETILSGTFANGMAIQPEKFTEVFTMYGRCWQFDLNDTQPIPGSFAGMKLMLNPQLNEYMTNVVINNYFQQGIALSLGYKDDPFMSDAIMLAPGTAANIIMKATRNTFAEAEFPMKPLPCRKDASLKILSAGYTSTTCIFDCYMQAINETCGCILLVPRQTHAIRLCNVSESITCATVNPGDQKQSYWWLTNVATKIQNCAQNCQAPCEDSMVIESVMSTTKINLIDKNQAIQLLEQIGRVRGWTEEFVTDAVQNAIMVKIYFTSTDLAVVATGETTPIMTFIGNVGGQLGLWMGISILSIIQILYYVFLGCVEGDLCSRKKKVQSIQTKPKPVTYK